MPTTAPYGTWNSELSAGLLAEKAILLGDVLPDPVTSKIFHVEGRPSEGGRNAIVDTATGKDIPGFEFKTEGENWNARTGVHEYGGGEAVAHDGLIYFSNFGDGRVYKVDVEMGADPIAVTPENKNHRFSSLAPHPSALHLLAAILEDHTKPAPADVVTTLVCINTQSQSITTLVKGSDFYSSPTFSPDGKKLAWVQWAHPDMPWEGGEVWVADVDTKNNKIAVVDGSAVKLAGQKEQASAVQPTWVDNSTLIFTYDVSGYQNPWIAKIVANEAPKAAPILPSPREEEFGEPGWILGNPCVVVLDAKTAVLYTYKGARSNLYVLDIPSKTLTELPSPYLQLNHLRRLSSNTFVFLGLTGEAPKAIVQCTLDSARKPTFKTLKSTADPAKTKIVSAYVSPAQPITLHVNGELCHLVYYPPVNPKYTAPAGEKPPCIMYIHGGPTGLSPQGLSLTRLYYTSRGFAWVDLNYGGSSGYGRSYVGRLATKWGIVDVADACAAATQLSSSPLSLADPDRMAITGGSAGGFTVLAVMCANARTDGKGKAFTCGASSFGVSDLRKLAEFTHKFESRYLDHLMGGSVEEAPEVYKTRSPISNAENIDSPLLILQGSIDAVVPPEQAESIVQKIKDRGGWVEYTLFDGEGHGWRKAENIIKALELEVGFYRRVWKLQEAV